MKRWTQRLLAVCLLCNVSLFADFDDGLVAYYRFNGNANDATGNGNDGVSQNLLYGTDRFGTPNSCGSFNGTNSLVTIPSLANFQYLPVTYSAWVKLHGFLPPPGGLLNQISVIAGRERACDGFGGALCLYSEPTYGTSSQIAYYTGSEHLPKPGQLNLNVWTHLAVSVDQDKRVSIFCNGNLVATRQFQVASTSQFPFTIGNSSPGLCASNGRYSWNGEIDDVRIYNLALSGNEVEELFWKEASNEGLPTITSQPRSQFSASGSNATFSVSALSQTPLGYQWYFSGGRIIDATDSSLVLTNAQSANRGLYSVAVCNAFGSIRSQDASLGVLADPTDGTPPPPLTYCPISAKQVGKDSLIVATHGLQLLGQYADLSWLDAMTNLIAQRVGTNWQVIAYKWPTDAWPTPDKAVSNGKQLGSVLGKTLASQNWVHIHLIGHSAGAALIQAAAEAIRECAADTIIHTTFLDPYVGFNKAGRTNYGSVSDWSDNYFSKDIFDAIEFSTISAALTEGPLDHAYNVEVTWLDPLKRIRPVYCSSPSSTPATATPCSYEAFSSHPWPHNFYTNTIPPNIVTNSEGFGFLLSKEGGNWSYATNHYATPNIQPHVLNGSQSLSQNSFPITTHPKISLSSLPNLSSGIIQVHPFGFSAASENDSDKNSVSQDIGSMTWLSLGISVTNAINFVTFDAQFTSVANAAGLLSIYWNTNEIGLIDEAAFSGNLQAYSFLLPGVFTNGNYALGFRLDPFTDSASSVLVTNISFGFAGITNSFNLSLDRTSTNQNKVLTLTAPAGYNFLLQSSTNLIDWLPTAILANTNNSVIFEDPGAPSSSRRFYRAVFQ